MYKNKETVEKKVVCKKKIIIKINIYIEVPKCVQKVLICIGEKPLDIKNATVRSERLLSYS